MSHAEPAAEALPVTGNPQDRHDQLADQPLDQPANQPVNEQDQQNQTAPRPPGSPEQRHHPRYPVSGDAEVTVSGGSTLLRGRMLNLSAGGCYIQSIAGIRLDPGTIVDILFKIDSPNIGWKVLRARCEVRYCKPKIGLGLRFLRMDRDAREIVASILDLLKAAEAPQTVPEPNSAR